MRHRSRFSSIVERFPILGTPPEEIVARWEPFAAMSERLAETRQARRLAPAGIKAGEAADHEAAVEAIVNGKELKDPTKHKREAEANANALEAREAAERVALDRLGDELADAIHRQFPEWIEIEAKALTDAEEQYRFSLAETIKAARKLASAKTNLRFVTGLEIVTHPSGARLVDIPSTQPDALRVRAGLDPNARPSVLDLLEAAAKVLEDQPVQPVMAKVAR